MKKPSKVFLIMVISFLSVFFAVANLIPVIGPAFIAYLLGNNKSRYLAYGLVWVHFFVSIMIGGLIFFLFSSPVIGAFILFSDPKNFWYLIVFNFLINLIFSVAFYFLGSYRHTLKIKKRAIH